MTKIYTTFEKLLIGAEKRLWADFQDAAEYIRSIDIGDGREATLIKFLQDHLPGRYCVTSGEIADSAGNRSGQVDVLIYDSSTTRPLLDDGKNVILPAEAVLATIEVKSSLTVAEISKTVKGIGNIRRLKPWDSAWESRARLTNGWIAYLEFLLHFSPTERIWAIKAGMKKR